MTGRTLPPCKEEQGNIPSQQSHGIIYSNPSVASHVATTDSF